MSHFRTTAQHMVLVMAVVATTSMCKRAGSLPPLAPLPQVSAPAAPTTKKAVAYRTQSGMPIAPSVIPDDAPPVAVQVVPEKVAAPQATLNGDPKGLSRESLNRSIQRSMGALANCFASTTQDPMVAVSFEADPSGRPSLVRVTGAPSDAEHCVRNIVQALRFPPFEGKGVEVDLPLSFHRVQNHTQAINPPGAQVPPAPTMFLQP